MNDRCWRKRTFDCREPRRWLGVDLRRWPVRVADAGRMSCSERAMADCGALFWPAPSILVRFGDAQVASQFACATQATAPELRERVPMFVMLLYPLDLGRLRTGA